MKGKHPGEIILSMASPSAKEITLEEVTDQRLPTPSPEIQEELITIMKIATACLNNNPQYRPTMHMISQILDAQIPLF
uniref:non-specific serine/threonine protein kinase n=1 Tax=Vernicia montana TaxID=316732 RepID=A0A140G4X2_9ROSI|nr:LRR-RLK [Vernicia montana]